MDFGVLSALFYLRAWYNGSTSASQAEDEGSIPFARTTLRICNASCGTAILRICGASCGTAILRICDASCGTAILRICDASCGAAILRICDASCGTAIKFSRPFVVGLIFGLFSLLDIMGFCCYGL